MAKKLQDLHHGPGKLRARKTPCLINLRSMVKHSRLSISQTDVAGNIQNLELPVAATAKGVVRTKATWQHTNMSASPTNMDLDDSPPPPVDKKDEAKVIIVTNLTRNVLVSHLKTIFAFYGEISKIDLPLYANCTFGNYH